MLELVFSLLILLLLSALPLPVLAGEGDEAR